MNSKESRRTRMMGISIFWHVLILWFGFSLGKWADGLGDFFMFISSIFGVIGLTILIMATIAEE